MLEATPIISYKGLTQHFSAQLIKQGLALYQKHRVKDFSATVDLSEIDAVVDDINQRTYTVEVFLYNDPYDEDYDENDEFSFDNIFAPVGTNSIDAYCSCRRGGDCAHVVATLLKAMEAQRSLDNLIPSKAALAAQVRSSNILSEVDGWLSSSEKIKEIAKHQPKNEDSHHLLYSLSTEISPRGQVSILVVNIYFAKILKKGGYGKAKDFHFSDSRHIIHAKDEDHDVLAELNYFKNIHHRTLLSYNDSQIPLVGYKASKCLENLLRLGRCYWDKDFKHPLSLGPTYPLQPIWKLMPDASQELTFTANEVELRLLKSDQLWYLDSHNYQCGLLETSIPLSTVELLVKLPKVPAIAVDKIAQQIKNILGSQLDQQWLPRALSDAVTQINLKPIPELTLDVKSLRLTSYYDYEQIACDAPIATIHFNYQDRQVPLSEKIMEEELYYVKDNALYVIKRNFDIERQYLAELSAIVSMKPLHDSRRDPSSPIPMLLYEIDSEDRLFELLTDKVKKIEKAGWRIIRKHETFYDVLMEEDISWYSELNEDSEYDYFNFNLGITVKDKNIDLLPIITQLMSTSKNTYFDELKEEDNIKLPLPDGAMLSIPFARIKPILNILVELYDTEVPQGNQLKLSKRQAALLYEINKAFEASRLRWLGGERLLNLGKKLSEFKLIETVVPPKSFKATLRDYQQNGVNWLQFLREYEMSGILADDMGLGKTVQTLAHLSIEKNKKRINKPCLVIAPTSLMTNWLLEAEKFAPDLKVLIFQGENRYLHYDKFTEYHLVLTTYPLLHRDKDVLLNYEFYYLILDEAQNIKNSKAKSTQIVHQLKAEHRLCLTGTPMENHLGELWSLFHFLMPGLLGDNRQFSRLFKIPIEKHQDTSRRKSLALRINPFMLRRQKSDVVDDLPEKNEIIQTVELQSAERDLYESIRLAMEKKVRNAIQKKGLSRSHIIILEALLKLRQVCCHPKLLKLDSAKKLSQHSAKLEWLEEMIPSMIEEGRRIILFSQFTSMLKIIEESFNQLNINYVKLTGTTKNRAKPIEAFQQGNVPVFLISLKAGGTGLNLTAADTVIHYDPWWNPAVEDQATDRAHRIGQNKSVFVYKLLAAGTVEETIQEMQQKKRALMEGLFAENKHEGGKLQLAADDLKNLFKPLG